MYKPILVVEVNKRHTRAHGSSILSAPTTLYNQRPRAMSYRPNRVMEARSVREYQTKFTTSGGVYTRTGRAVKTKRFVTDFEKTHRALIKVSDMPKYPVHCKRYPTN